MYPREVRRYKREAGIPARMGPSMYQALLEAIASCQVDARPGWLEARAATDSVFERRLPSWSQVWAMLQEECGMGGRGRVIGWRVGGIGRGRVDGDEIVGLIAGV